MQAFSVAILVLSNLYTGMFVLTHENEHMRADTLTQPELFISILSFSLGKHCLPLCLSTINSLLMTTQGYNSLTHRPGTTFWISSV